MGLFDWVTHVPKAASKCVKCGAKLEGWQSKDGECYMTHVPYWAVRNFYTSCSECGKWHEYTLRHRPRRKLTDYTLRH